MCRFRGGTPATPLTARAGGDALIRYRFCKWLSDNGQPATLLPPVVLAMMRWQHDIDMFHIYNVWPLPGASLYKLLGGKKPVVATFNNYAGFCPKFDGLCLGDECNFIEKTKCMVELRGARKKSVFIVLSVLYAAVYPLLTWLVKRADRYIAFSESSKQLHIKYGYDKDKIDVIPNFVEPYIMPDLPAPVKSHGFNILYVGTVAKTKDVEILIKAFYKLADNNPDIHLKIVGDGPQMAQLAELTSVLGIKELVVFTGKVLHEDIWKHYRDADVSVHPGIWAEPFGRIILKAMQANLPLIVSDVGAPPEIVDGAGLVFRAGDVDDLTRKLECVNSDIQLRQRLSSNCTVVLARYEKDVIVERILDVYKRVPGS